MECNKHPTYRQKPIVAVVLCHLVRLLLVAVFLGLSSSIVVIIPVAHSLASSSRPLAHLGRNNKNNKNYKPGNSKIHLYSTISTTGDELYYSPSYMKNGERDFLQSSSSSFSQIAAVEQKQTLTRFLQQTVQEKPELREMISLLLAVQLACKSISTLVTRVPSPPITSSPSCTAAVETTTSASAEYRSMARLDQLSTIVLRNALRFTGKFRMAKPANVDVRRRKSTTESSSKEDYHPTVLIAKALDSKYVAIFDPLDGSNNADASVCTGTLFGVFETTTATVPTDSSSSAESQSASVAKEKKTVEELKKEALMQSILQPGRNLKAAGYCMYSSATILVFTIGNGVHMFTLDPQINEFVLTNPNVCIPQRGSIYSCNESNSEGWSNGMKSYITALKTGRGESGTRYTGRYIGSMVGDIHRTLTYGGIFAYPRDEFYHPNGNIQLLYKSAPFAYIISQAGGKSSTGEGQDVLDVTPQDVHERQPCFLGSPDDIDEMKKYMASL